MTIESNANYCKFTNLKFVIKPDNILTFDNPDMMFISENNELIGCIVSSATEQRNENYLLRRLFQIRTHYPEEMMLIVLNRESVKNEDLLRHYCHFASVTDDKIRSLENIIGECKNNKDVVSITKKFRLQLTKRSHEILMQRQMIRARERIGDVIVPSWGSDKTMSSNKIYAIEDGYCVNLMSSKDNHVLTILNSMDYDTRQKYIGYNSDYYGLQRFGVIKGKVRDTRKYELSLKYSYLGVNCIFED